MIVEFCNWFTKSYVNQCTSRTIIGNMDSEPQILGRENRKVLFFFPFCSIKLGKVYFASSANFYEPVPQIPGPYSYNNVPIAFQRPFPFPSLRTTHKFQGKPQTLYSQRLLISSLKIQIFMSRLFTLDLFVIFQNAHAYQPKLSLNGGTLDSVA